MTGRDRAPARVELRIDRLVLDDPAPGLDPRRLRSAVEAELTRLLTERGVPSGLTAGARATVRAPVALAGPAAGESAAPAGRSAATAVAHGIAAAIYRGLGS